MVLVTMIIETIEYVRKKQKNRCDVHPPLEALEGIEILFIQIGKYVIHVVDTTYPSEIACKTIPCIQPIGLSGQ